VSKTQNRKRAGADNYPTPLWAIRRFFEALDWDQSGGARWLEPAVGEGSIVSVANEFVPGIEWDVCDLRDVRPYMVRCGVPEKRVTVGDFLDNTFGPDTFDVVIMNPPFNRLAQFINEATRVARTVICFQSLNMLGSDDRVEWMKTHVPDTYVLPNRVSHTGDGKTDSVYAAWFVWPDTRQLNRAGTLRVLDSTLLSERKRDASRVSRARDSRSQVLDSLFYEALR